MDSIITMSAYNMKLFIFFYLY